jgi:hypothetical protein
VAMKRYQFQHDGLMFSYLDAGGDGRILVALHAHWMEGLTFAPLAAELAPGSQSFKRPCREMFKHRRVNP